MIQPFCASILCCLTTTQDSRPQLKQGATMVLRWKSRRIFPINRLSSVVLSSSIDSSRSDSGLTFQKERAWYPAENFLVRFLAAELEEEIWKAPCGCQLSGMNTIAIHEPHQTLSRCVPALTESTATARQREPSLTVPRLLDRAPLGWIRRHF